MLAWLKRVAFNKTIHVLKQLSRFDDEIEQTIDINSSVETIVDDERMFLLILSKVGVSKRLVFWLYFVEQYKHREIAQLTGKSLSYSKLVISRTISFLQKSPDLAEVVNA